MPPPRISLEVECADVRNSVLVISIIRLKTTVDMNPNPDITWEYVRNGIWWLVYINFCKPPTKDMSNQLLG
jgi:hypothetical protein